MWFNNVDYWIFNTSCRQNNKVQPARVNNMSTWEVSLLRESKQKTFKRINNGGWREIGKSMCIMDVCCRVSIPVCRVLCLALTRGAASAMSYIFDYLWSDFMQFLSFFLGDSCVIDHILSITDCWFHWWLMVQVDLQQLPMSTQNYRWPVYL